LGGDYDTAFHGPATPTSPVCGISSAVAADPANNFTVTLLIRPDGVPPASGFGCLLQFGASGFGAPELGILDQGGGFFKIRVGRSAVGTLFSSSSSWAYGTPLHVKLSRDSGDLIALRVNGVSEGSTTFAFSSFTTRTNLGFYGSTNPPDFQFYGAIDEFAVWNSFVSDTTTDAQYAAAWPPGISAGQLLGNLSQDAAAERIYWNPADKNAAFDLSNSNKTATRTGATAWVAARASRSRTSGKYYFEQTIEALGTSGADSIIHGLGVVTTPLTDYIGSSTSGTTAWGLQVAATPNARTTFNNGFQYTSTPPQTAGGYSRWAIDLTAGNIWIGTPAGWLNGGDPAAGTSPTFTFTPSLELFPMLSGVSAGASVTLLTRSSEFLGGAPAGFSDWEGGGAGATNGVSAAQTLGALTQVASAELTSRAIAATQGLSGVSQVATATVKGSAAASQTLGVVSQAATAVTINDAASVSASQVLGGITQVASLRTYAGIASAQLLGSVAQAATLRLLAKVSGSKVLGGLAQTANARVASALLAAQILGSISQIARVARPVSFERNERTLLVAGERRGYAVVGEIRSATAVPELRTVALAGENRRIAFTD